MTGLDGGVSLETLVNHRVCPVCARWLPPDGCERCRRLRAIGALVVLVTVEWIDDGGTPRLPGPALRGLDAIAFLLTERAQLVRSHRRERNEDAREADRGAREAYGQGRDEGRAESGGGWW